MERLTFTCLLLFCITTLAFAQGLPMAVPEDVGVSAERLERIRPVMQGYVDDGRIAGLLTAVARRGKIVHFQTIGMGDIENNKPIEADTIFRIHSMSKPITSVAVMMLYEEGHFQLDTPVSDFIPEFKNMKVYNEDQTEILDAKREITIKHLLTHTAGLTYGWGNEPVDDRYREANLFQPGTTLVDSMKKLSEIPSFTNRGTGGPMGSPWMCSATSWRWFLECRLKNSSKPVSSAPLGMVDTAFSVPLEKLDRFAALYQLNKEGGMKGDKAKEKKRDGAIGKEKEMKGDKDQKMRLERVEKDARLASGEVRFFPGRRWRTRLNGTRLYAVFSDVAQRWRTGRCPRNKKRNG